jgi:hypothetical protein
MTQKPVTARVNLTLDEAQARALDEYIKTLLPVRVSHAQAALALVVESLQSRRLLPEDEA